MLAFANAEDYESADDSGGNNVYDVTITIGDGTNTGATITYAVTIDNVATAITAGQSDSVAENAAVDDDVMTVATTGDTPTLFAITAGNAHGNFKINSAGLIEIASTTNMDYETTTSYTLTIAASDSTTSDSATLTIAISDINDQTPTYSSSDTTPDIAEGTTAVETVAITDTDTGDSNSCTRAGADAALFTCTVSATQYVLAFANAEDYDDADDAGGNNVYDVTVTILSLIHI